MPELRRARARCFVQFLLKKNPARAFMIKKKINLSRSRAWAFTKRQKVFVPCVPYSIPYSIRVTCVNTYCKERVFLWNSLLNHFTLRYFFSDTLTLGCTALCYLTGPNMELCENPRCHIQPKSHVCICDSNQCNLGVEESKCPFNGTNGGLRMEKSPFLITIVVLLMVMILKLALRQL